MTENNKSERQDIESEEGNMPREDYVWIQERFRRNSDGTVSWVNGYWKKVERSSYPHKSTTTYSGYSEPSGSSVIGFALKVTLGADFRSKNRTLRASIKEF